MTRIARLVHCDPKPDNVSLRRHDTVDPARLRRVLEILKRIAANDAQSTPRIRKDDA